MDFINEILNFFKGITLEGIDFQDKAALLTLVKQIGYSIVLWLIALFAVINFFAYLNVTFAIKKLSL